jgi:hypothetical protein
MPTVTLDTNILPFEPFRTALKSKGFEFAIVSVTSLELGSSGLRAVVQRVGIVPETAVWNASPFGVGLYGGTPDDRRLERILQVITNGSFPVDRAELTDNERHQLRDAMIFYAHVRDKRDIFVTDDVRGFIDHGRREALQSEFETKIMTGAEFAAAYGAAA